MRLAVVALIPALIAGSIQISAAVTEGELGRFISSEIAPLIPADEAGGIAVGIRMKGQNSFFNYGFADRAATRPITSDSVFNIASLRKLFEVTLLALAIKQRELGLDDLAAKYVTELRPDSYVGRVTLGQLATHTSGLLLPTDHPPWPDHGYTLSEFFRVLNSWTPDQGQKPGKQHIYSHAAFVLLQLALERRFASPVGELMERRIFEPLGLSSTVLPERGADGRAKLPPALVSRAVQGYSSGGNAIGMPGDQQGYFDFPGTGQMFSSARDLAVFLAAQLGEPPLDRLFREAMQLTQQGVFAMRARHIQGLAWEINDYGGPLIIDKPGGLNNASAYIGMVPSKKLGIILLANRGEQHLHEVARQRILPALAR